MKFEIAPEWIKATWDDARLYCFSLNIDGKTGWRLPTVGELHRMYNLNLIKPANWWSSEMTNNHIKYMSPYRKVRYSTKDYLFGVCPVRDLKDNS